MLPITACIAVCEMFVNSLCDGQIGYSDTVYCCSLCAVIKLMVLGISWSVSCDGSTRTLAVCTV